MDDHPLLTPTETAQLLKVSLVTVRRWIRTGKLDTVRLPSGRHRILAAGLTDTKRPRDE